MNYDFSQGFSLCSDEMFTSTVPSTGRLLPLFRHLSGEGSKCDMPDHTFDDEPGLYVYSVVQFLLDDIHHCLTLEGIDDLKQQIRRRGRF